LCPRWSLGNVRGFVRSVGRTYATRREILREQMNKNQLVRWFGFPATLFHHDTLVLDRWLWLRRRLPRTRNGEALIDIGCGTGAFAIGAAKRGYRVLGISWDQRNQEVAAERGHICGADNVRFEVLDIRRLGERPDLKSYFEFALCLETIEHVLNDKKLINDIFDVLVPGGILLMTTPYYHYRAITTGENGPFPREESGGHVRRGYTETMIRELCTSGGFLIEDISYCSGFMSQKITWILRRVAEVNWLIGWLAILPLRIFPPLLDPILRRLTAWPDYSICVQAQKPRFR
jgi:2-polyprenyl-3-methyl-5-hydroxy-6-metoxy-1,4-benzoquinol methylase